MQERTQPPAPLVEVKESEKRTLAVEQDGEEQLFGTPVMRINRYSGKDKEWVELVRWDVPESHLGDLHSITLISDQIAKTRYRLAYSPLEMVWRRNQVPAKTSVYIQVMSLDGTEIAVNALLTGAVKWVDIADKNRDNKEKEG